MKRRACPHVSNEDETLCMERYLEWKAKENQFTTLYLFSYMEQETETPQHGNHVQNGNGNHVQSHVQNMYHMDKHLHLCLFCSFSGGIHKISPHLSGFIKHSFQTSHFLSLHSTTGHIYCSQCQDYIYPEATCDARREASTTASKHQNNMEWLTSSEGREHWDDISFLSNLHLPFGVRGLYNMGNTCFMSCILQSMIHNPMIRNYFLSDMHHPKSCILKKRDQDALCLACDLNAFINTMFSSTFGDERSRNGHEQSSDGFLSLLLKSMEVKPWISPSAIVPHRLLYSMWQNASHLAGYEQHDAHEFLLGFLDGIHSHTHCNLQKGGMSPRSGSDGTTTCHCVVHTTFAGVLRSDVTCSACSSVSTAYDPFFDLSLSLNIVDTDKKVSGSSSCEKTTTSLYDYLDKFMHKEYLIKEDQARCEKCNSYQDCIKQLSIKTIPNVVVIHLKRFDALMRSKITTFVHFPAHSLDLSRYATQVSEPNSVPGSEQQQGIPGSKPNNIPGSEHKEEDLYDLFAVVNHHGTINSGHYTNFARSGNHWYKFDDATVTRVEEAEVCRSEAYLLFYIRRHLIYE